MQCLTCMCVYSCACVCTRNNFFFLSSNACWNVYNPSSVRIYHHDGAGRFTAVSFISFISSVYLCRRRLWYDNVCPGYSQQHLESYFCNPFSPFSPLIYTHKYSLMFVFFWRVASFRDNLMGWDYELHQKKNSQLNLWNSATQTILALLTQFSGLSIWGLHPERWMECHVWWLQKKTKTQERLF